MTAIPLGAILVNVKTAILTQGLPASGKSTWCREWQKQNFGVVVNNDTIRTQLYAQTGTSEWSHAFEKLVRQERENQIRRAAEQHLDCIVDNTHMNVKTLQQTKSFCESLGYTVVIKSFLDVGLDECIRRDALREGSAKVGEWVIRKMWQQWCSSNAEPLPAWVPSKLPVAVIVDVDGTLADHKGLRSPYEEHLVYLDRPRHHVIAAVDSLNQTMFAKIIVMSGRTEKCRDLTASWISQHTGWQLPDYHLLMRSIDDRRADSEVKLELYQKHVQGVYSVMAVFDDRAQVIRGVWRQLKLPVFRCGVIDEDEF